MNYHLLFCSFWLYGVYGSHEIGDKLMLQPGSQNFQTKPKDTNGVPSGDMMVQVISNPVSNIHSFYWLESKKCLYAVELVTDKLHIWNYKNAKFTSITLMPGEPVSFFIPFKDSDKKAIVGSGKNLRIFEGTENDFTVSDPVLKLEEEGYCMHHAHCDGNGVLYILANYLLVDNSKGSILYIVKNKKLQQMKKFDCTVLGFTISDDNKNMYVITNIGKKIKKYNLDADEGKLSNEKTFFTLSSEKTFIPFEARSIALDGENNLYASIGLSVAKIDKDGKLKQATRTPFIVTALTFGGSNYKNLFTGTTKLIDPFDDQAGSILAISGFATSGQPDYPVKW